MAMVGVDNSSVQVDQVGWLVLRVGGHFALFNSQQMNWVKSRNVFATAPQRFC